MKVFDRAASRLTSTERTNLLATLGRWVGHSHIGRHVDEKLREEEWLLVDAMIALQQTIASCATEPIPAIEAKFQEACYEHVGKGGVANPTPAPSLAGHAVDRQAFLEYLSDQFPAVFPDAEQAEVFLEKLLAGGALTGLEQQIPVRRHLMWATFDGDNSARGPFDFATSETAEEIRACLGLDQWELGPVMLFVYSWSAPDDMLRPTVADAGLHYNFAQASAKSHGMTRPWAPGVHACGDSYDPLPRPEVVHYPIRLSMVVAAEERDG